MVQPLLKTQKVRLYCILLTLMSIKEYNTEIIVKLICIVNIVSLHFCIRDLEKSCDNYFLNSNSNTICQEI